jgi:precorrin-6B methylase 2
VQKPQWLAELYEKSVQNVEHEVEFMQTTFQQIRGRKAHLFREDFCGTASVCCQWVRQGEDYQAIGVDIDPKVLEWGRTNRLAKLATADQPRVSLIELLHFQDTRRTSGVFQESL